jgi:hypothetical protein
MVSEKTRVRLGSFSLEATNDWTLSTVILAGPVDDVQNAAAMPTTKAVRPFQRNIVATMEQVESTMTLEAYVKRQVDGLRQAGVQRTEVAKPERVKVASAKDALITEQVIMGQTGERVRQMQLVCIKDGLAHVVIASHLDGATFEAARASFRSMLLSFE